MELLRQLLIQNRSLPTTVFSQLDDILAAIAAKEAIRAPDSSE